MNKLSADHVRSKRQEDGTPQSDQEDRDEREENLDKTIADSFPASDPPSSIPDPDEKDTAA